ncbi:MAG: S41 family peptidase, partial [Defluviitaleaceae bacterium]|nr:S41 family peptidase [Defluviitaleaceae bacterium]
MKRLRMALLVVWIAFLAACGSSGATEEEQGGWSADIERLREHVIQWHPRFANDSLNQREDNTRIRREFEVSLDRLLLDLGYLSDFEIKAEIQRSIALLEDNHFFFTGFSGYFSQMRLLRYPLIFGYFSDGFYLYRAAEEFSDALNLRLVALNGIDVQHVFEDFSRFWSVENVYDARYQFAALLNAPMVLQALGISTEEGVRFTFEGGTEILVTQYHQWERLLTTLRWLPTIPLTDARAEGDLPLFRRNLRQNLWHEFVPEYGILYISIRGWVTDVNGVFGESVRNTFRENHVQAVIIDARGNPGGDANQFNGLFTNFARNLPEGRLFYFVNEGSNSGSLGAAYFLEDLGAVILGQPLAQNSEFYWFGSGESQLFLDYS